MNGSAEPRFLIPEPFPGILNNDLHIWKIPVLPVNFYFLSSEERAVAERFRFEEDRLRFSVARQSLRLLLANYLSILPQELIFSTRDNQKPILVSPVDGLHFNISHSGGWVLVAVASEEVGIDIEILDEDFAYQNLLPEHFSEKEQEFISGSPDQLRAFYYLWTRKEAVTKAWGTGLQENLKTVTVSDQRSLRGPDHKIWTLESLSLSPFYPAAVAFSGGPRNIVYFDGSSLNP